MLPLLRFQTAKTHSPISLEEYISGFEDTTEPILYVTGPSRSCLVNSPYVRGALEEGKDVLLMVDPIDEHMMQRVKTFQEHPFVNISRCNDRFHVEEVATEYETVCSLISKALGEDVEKVVVSKRLAKDTPCCLVSGTHGWSANMERLMNAQTFSTNTKMDNIFQKHYNKKVMEINPEHDIIQHLTQNTANDHTATIRLLFDTAMLSAGFAQEDPSSYAGRVYNMIALGVTGGGLEPEEETPLPSTEDDETPMESLD
jgi:HSP90 family molecular chaperone